VAVEDVPEFEQQLYEFMDEQHYDVLQAIRTSGKLEPQTEEALKTAVSELLSRFRKEA
jgi:F-type H+-transporting ATPase subunit alpha